MIKITKKQLEKLGACENGVQWFLKTKKKSLKALLPLTLRDDHGDYARWLLSRLMTHPQKVQWAIYSAEQVIELFEKKYPNDKRPRQAIQAAKDFLAGKITAHAADAAAHAAAYAAHAAYATAYAAYAAYATAYAAYAANAAHAAAYAAHAAYATAYAANAAANAAYAANAAATKKMEKKLLVYALKLLGEY